VTDPYLNGPVAEKVAANPHWIDDELARIAAELSKTRRFVYASRDKGFDPEAPTESSHSEAPAAPAPAPGGTA
jgi:hypothetical protein